MARGNSNSEDECTRQSKKDGRMQRMQGEGYLATDKVQGHKALDRILKGLSSDDRRWGEVQ
jgi:hypothetical protein